MPCGHCPYCRAGQTNLCLTYDELGFTRDGAAAAFVTVQRSLVHPLAPGVSAEDAALAEPASVVYRALAGAGIVPGGGRWWSGTARWRCWRCGCFSSGHRRKSSY